MSIPKDEKISKNQRKAGRKPSPETALAMGDDAFARFVSTRSPGKVEAALNASDEATASLADLGRYGL